MMLCRWSGISEYHVICMDYIHRYWNLECSHTHPLNVYIAIDMYMYTYVNVYHTLVFLKRNITHIVWNSSKWLPCQLTVMIEPSFFHYFEIWILYNSITFYIYIYIFLTWDWNFIWDSSLFACKYGCYIHLRPGTWNAWQAFQVFWPIFGFQAFQRTHSKSSSFFFGKPSGIPCFRP